MASRAERALSFGTVAADYDRLRPEPADAAADWLLPPGCAVAVDLGAGTGKLTRALAARVPRVIAVEPDERMREVLASRSPGVTALAGRGEDIPLPDASADAVLISSAWHWMDPVLAVAEITRVLRDGGRLGLIWTTMDRDAPWRRSIREHSTWPARDRDARDRRADMPASELLTGITTAQFPFSRPMSADGLIELFSTYSDVITASDADRAARLAQARAAVTEFFPGPAEVDVPMMSRCWRASRLPRAMAR